MHTINTSTHHTSPPVEDGNSTEPTDLTHCHFVSLRGVVLKEFFLVTPLNKFYFNKIISCPPSSVHYQSNGFLIKLNKINQDKENRKQLYNEIDGIVGGRIKII